MTSAIGHELDFDYTQPMAKTAGGILGRIHALPEGERLHIVERVVHEVVEQKSATPVQGASDARLWADVSDKDFERLQEGLRQARALPVRSHE